MTMTKESFHTLAQTLSEDWLYGLIVSETQDFALAEKVLRATKAISWHEMMKYAYKDTGLSVGKFQANTSIHAPDGIYDALKELTYPCTD